MNTYLLEFYAVGLGVIMLLWEAFAAPKNKSKLALIGSAGLGVILVLLILGSYCPACKEVPSWLSRFYSTRGEAIFFKGFALISTILVLIMSYDFRGILNKFTSNDNSDIHSGEFYILPIFACAGLMWMASAIDLVSIFVSLELVTITFYVMVAYMRRNVGSLEAGVKYLILGALSTGFFVYGIAWVYGALGTTDLTKIAEIMSPVNVENVNQYSLLFGLSLVVLAIGFKVGAVPMQLWIPDVYQGAPNPITAFLSIASKAAGFGVAIVILRPFIGSELVGSNVTLILSVMAAATLIYGNFSALTQTNFKRLLAYSSISHAGFILLVLAVGNYQAVKFYLATYLVMNFAGFYILNLVRIQDNSDEIDAFNGLGKKNPRLSVALTITMAAMAGVPLTAGFIGKFFVIQSIAGNLHMTILAIAIIAAASGFFYYFKVIRSIYWHQPANNTALTIPLSSKIVITTLTLLIITIGIYPKVIECLLG